MTAKEILMGAALTVVTGVVLLFAEKYILHDGEAPPSPAQVSRQADPAAINIPEPALNAPPPFLNNPPPAQKKPAPLSLAVNYVYRPAAAEFQNIPEGGVLHSGDSYKIIFTPTPTAYVYIFQKGPTGNLFRLFPLERWGDDKLDLRNPVSAPTYVPAPDKSFVLDETTGTETFYVLAFRERQPLLEDTYTHMLTAAQQGDTGLARQYHAAIDTFIKTRDPGPALIADTARVSWQEQGNTYAVPRQKLDGPCEDCVSVLSFQHR